MTEAALLLGLCEQRRDVGIAAGGDDGQAIERTGDQLRLNDLVAAAAIPAGDAQPRLIEGARKAEAAARAFGALRGELDQRERTELAVDRPGRLDRSSGAEVLGRHRGVGARSKLAAGTVDLDHQARARRVRLAPGHDVLA